MTEYWIYVLIFVFFVILVSIQYVLNRIVSCTEEMLRLLQILVNRES